MVSSPARLKGRQKAATLLIALGADVSAAVLKHLKEADIERLTLEIFSMEKVPEELKDNVFDECYQMALAREYITSGGADYARQMLASALGHEKAEEMLGRLSTSMRPIPFDFLRGSDPLQLAQSLQEEHPQTIALVLAHLAPNQSARVLAVLPEELQVDVATRIAIMDRTPPEVIESVEGILRRRLSNFINAEYRSVGGTEYLVRLLTISDRRQEKLVLESLEDNYPELAEEVMKLMFVFENLTQLDDRSLQRVMREVDSKDLALALRGASEDLKEKVFRNLSTRAASMIKEEMALSGPVRVRQVEESQQRIVTIVRRLEEAEEIVVTRGGEDVLV